MSRLDERIILEKISRKEADSIKPYPTRLLDADDPRSITKSANALKQGDLVVFPTDTVYGIGTNPFDEQAVLKLYQVKKRPLDKGIPILLADLNDLPKVAIVIPKTAGLLIAHFWPGPLTLIVPKHPALPAAISITSSVAVRIPANVIARSLIRQAGGAVAASSANVSGEKPADSASSAMATFQGLVSIVLDGGFSGENVSSTIIDCTGLELRILREGPIKPAELNEVISNRV